MGRKFSNILWNIFGWGFIATLALLGLYVIVALSIMVANQITDTVMLSPCTQEDSMEDCYWDGGKNNMGDKFVVLDGKVYYAEH